MAKKNLRKTPRSKVRDALRRLWLRSRERAFACKRDQYTCQCCGKKQSKARGKEVAIEVHHRHGIHGWEQVIDSVYDFLLTDPDGLEVLCKDCHKNHS